MNFNEQFARRLRDTMLAAGFSSTRSTSGIDLHPLVEITGHSPQICRKYLRGQAIPELSKLINIAAKLNVSPGWLLFGDQQSNSFIPSGHVSINKYLLHYIFKQAEVLYRNARLTQDIPDFLLALVNDITQINVSEEQSKRIIDLALSSAEHFNH